MILQGMQRFIPLYLAATILACAGEDGPAEEGAAPDGAATAETQPAGQVEPGVIPSDPSGGSTVASDLEGQAPDLYRARFETSEGDFIVEVHREWAPLGADRFYNLVSHGYYDGVRFFRVLDGFMAQFGINGDPRIAAQVQTLRIRDDSVRMGNTRGRISFATSGPDTRTSQVFINFGDNSSLDASGFAAFGEVVEGMEVVDALHSGYGEGAPSGPGPDQRQIRARGNAYLEAEFPELDYVERATIIEP
jgi:peptidyl-prolyl cis-trans isomerase A (cyclophilin A)